jgi:uncharacterized RDD family membrane protein YckC
LLIKSIVYKRVKAFAIDYLIILLYVGILFLITLSVSRILSLNPERLSPFKAQLLGFTTLTLPVVLYFTLLERSKHAASIGKRKTRLQVVSSGGTKAALGQLILRNCIKFLPWEFAHFFVFRLFSFLRLDAQPPDWVLTGLVLSQGLAVLYLICLVVSKNNRSIYEWLSGTKVIEKVSS